MDAAAAALKSGGRIIYMGAGASGRLGVLDASECPRRLAFARSGRRAAGCQWAGALLKAVEGCPKTANRAGERSCRAKSAEQDLVVGLAASGRTPMAIGGLRYARQSVVPLLPSPVIQIRPPVRGRLISLFRPLSGPEALTGSTRLKSGTAQKMVLNMISTGAMVKFAGLSKPDGGYESHQRQTGHVVSDGR